MTLHDQSVLVTGATGFLGAALARRLADEGARVKAFVRSPDKAATLRALPRLEIVEGDVTDGSSLRPALEGCRLIFHTAASFGDLDSQRRVNVEGTRIVTEAAADAGVSRLIHVSTVAAYGYNVHGEVGEDRPLRRSCCDPYNITKVEGEEAILSVAAQSSLAYSIIRPGMIYGPGSDLWTRRMFRLARLRPTPFIGAGSGSAHPIYIDDVVDMMVVLGTHPSAHNQAFNCAPDPAPTWRDFLGEYQKLAGHHRWLPVPPVLARAGATVVGAVAPSGKRLKDSPDFVKMLLRPVTYSMDKARRLLNWEPSVSLTAGVARTAPWLREQGLLR